MNVVMKALLARKLADEFVRSPYAIEDLLTSVVLGTCAYLPTHDALVGFVGMARTVDGTTLKERLTDVKSVEAVFWHSWDGFTDHKDTKPNKVFSASS